MWNAVQNTGAGDGHHPPCAVFRYCWGERPVSRLKMAENCAELEKPQR